MAGDSVKSSSDNTHSTEARNASRQKLERWLNKSMRIKMTDGRTLIGTFVCTDCECNIIMGSCEEYLKAPDSDSKEDPRILGLAMVPGKHVISIEIDDTSAAEEESSECATRKNSVEDGCGGLEIDTRVCEKNISDVDISKNIDETVLSQSASDMNISDKDIS